MHHNKGMLEEHLQLIEGSYSPSLVALSIALAIIACYTALTMNERAKNDSFFPKPLWQFLASISLAFSIWSLHYIGMFSFALPIPITYDISLTMFSIIPSLIASFIIFYTINKDTIATKKSVLLAAVITGGVLSMHCIGMSSMQFDALHEVNYLIMVLSVGVMFIISYLFIHMHHCAKRAVCRFMFASLLAVGIATLHYGSMHAMTFYVQQRTAIGSTFIVMDNVRLLSMLLTLGVLLLVAILLIASLCDRYIEYRTKNFDLLTKLPNSIALSKTLKHSYMKQLAVWHFEDFDFVNKTYGYETGDQYILQLVALLKERWPHKHILYQIEKNRIAVVSVESKNIFMKRLVRMQQKFQQPVEVNGHMISPRIICALSNENTYAQSEHLLEQTLAVLASSSTSIHQITEYRSELHNNVIETMISQDIQTAMQEGQLYVVYQPKVGISCKKIVGAEALIRWEHPTLGFLSPGAFIPILEETDQIKLVTDWVIEQVAKQKAEWNAQTFDIPSISVNIPANYITSQHLLDFLDATIAKYQLHPSELDVEITETTFVSNIEEAMRAITVISEKGYGVSLDDFGTGLSSLSYLRQMPITTLKIDKSFVDSIPHSKRDCAIMHSMLVLCESLQLGIVIEGVETVEQLDFLSTISQIAVIQGYFFSAPLQSDAFYDWCQTFIKNNSPNISNAH